ncbi:3,4-dihydroxy-2-butanone-4-phosphate synthase [Salipiger sp. P9]|uniref:3,4-dihydroxy-2-butanone-4-phosphate synthase n=1 Tax=Salipiger pentaromativorans TaxID=2943193 RepID=UPI0021586BA9|nr:3,4-dihydroxy-2-butanone-4-phosphate synthase [Salipiger pentaromativorans]MCR8549229.1 3,4-dihydroxy-2-butanone-4-phosphate synthase [Salipiger pentaromativorans]
MTLQCGLAERPQSPALASVQELIEEAKAGRMFILLDHADRDNAGDLVIPAQFVTPDAINFMATHARGLVCLSLTRARVEELGIKPLPVRNSERQGTAFLTSIEAREGIDTGISAFDRARTIRVAQDAAFGAADIVTPGHVFPLRAHDGGVLVRAGHTEASVDICRLAGLTPAAATCEIIRDDGEMARLPDLLDFAQRHGMKIGAISDLVAYRQRHDGLVRETGQRVVRSRWGGDWTLRLFEDRFTGTQHMALSKGDLDTDAPVLTRVHTLDALSDALGIGDTPGLEASAAMCRIADEGRGVLVLLRNTDAATQTPGADGGTEMHDFGRGAQILAALGLTRLRVLSHAALPRLVGLDSYGLRIEETELLAGAETAGDPGKGGME